jgi:hypothetical protein
MAKGTNCYITAPSHNKGHFFFEGTYDEGFKRFLKKECPVSVWDPCAKRWEVPKAYLNKVKNRAQVTFDQVQYATDGDYETIGGLDYGAAPGGNPDYYGTGGY